MGNFILTRPPGYKPNPVLAALAKLEAADKKGAKRKPAEAAPVSIPKSNMLRSEPYRRLVAALACANCHVDGHSQAAHPPPTGKSMKEDDRECFPLCATRQGKVGCHDLFDQYKLVPQEKMRTQAAKWGKQTRQTIIDADEWPKKLPRWDEKGAKA